MPLILPQSARCVYPLFGFLKKIHGPSNRHPLSYQRKKGRMRFLEGIRAWRIVGTISEAGICGSCRREKKGDQQHILLGNRTVVSRLGPSCFLLRDTLLFSSESGKAIFFAGFFVFFRGKRFLSPVVAGSPRCSLGGPSRIPSEKKAMIPKWRMPRAICFFHGREVP